VSSFSILKPAVGFKWNTDQKNDAVMKGRIPHFDAPIQLAEL